MASLLALVAPLAAQSGFVKSAGQAIPGAVVTASQGTQSVSTITDTDGHYGFALLPPGAWQIKVEMFGFDPLRQDVDFAAAKGPVNLEIHLTEPAYLRRMQPGGATSGSASSRSANNSQTAALDPELQSALNSSVAPSSAPASTGASGANETFLVSGSISPGAAEGAQPDFNGEPRFGGPGGFGGENGNPPGFGGNTGQTGGGLPGGGGGFGGPGGFGGGGGRGGPAGFGGGNRGGRDGQGRRPGGGNGAVFGNARRRTQTIHGQASYTLANSAVNAQPFSINGLTLPQASYAQSRFSLIVGGPLVIPKLFKDPKTQFFLTYFGTRSRTPQLFTETVPTSLQRLGDFSQSVQSLGTGATAVPITVYDPSTHQPYANNRIPTSLLSPISLALLRYYPLPNQSGVTNNFQNETTQVADSDNFGARIQRSLTTKDRVSLNVQYQRRDGTTAQPFSYFDDTSGYGINAQATWTRNLNSRAISNTQFRFNRNRNEITPYFSTVPNIAAQLGLPGISSDPLNAGPPTLNFTNFGALSDGLPTLTRNQSQGMNESVVLLRGKHSLSFGAGYTRADLSSRTNRNARGTFNFTGVATSAFNAGGQPVSGTGYDLADYLLGFPQSSSIQYSQFANYFTQNQWTFYSQDEWKLKPNLTLTLGLRYEAFSPFAEKYGRAANLDIAPNYSAVAVVTPGSNGPYSGAIPDGLINPDRNNWAPRVGLAWKVPSKRSTIVRADYGIFYNEQAYVQFGNALAQQPPFATSNSVNTSSAQVLTLSQGFATTNPRDVTNTFAVDRNYRTPYAGTWNVSIQRDLPFNLFAEIGYLGTKGTRLDVRTLPNQPPPGSALTVAQRNQLGNAVGFTYDQSIGNSIFHSGHVRLNRRFSHGVSMNLFYQYAKSIDNSSTFGGAGNTVAQNWLNLNAERGLSSFDVRHQLSTDFVWTSPIGETKSRISADSAAGKLLKDWQFSGHVQAQSGNPLTARVLGNGQQLAQTGGVGSGRAQSTGQSVNSSSGFFDLNAFTVAPAGFYGNAGRNTIPGPGTVTLNLSVGRSFTVREGKRLEFRVESTNLLNHVNYTSYYTVVNSVNYGLPSAAGGMRTLDAVVRFRF